MAADRSSDDERLSSNQLQQPDIGRPVSGLARRMFGVTIDPMLRVS